MVSVYSDKVREERYFQLRRKKKQCETCLAFCLAAFALIMFAELVGGACSYSMAVGLHVNAIAKLQRYHLLPNLAVFAVGLSGILFRKWLPALIGAVGILLVTFAGWMTPICIGTFGLIPLGFTVAAGLQWASLKKEEGFPRFQIDFEEYEVNRKAQTNFVQQRALQQGVRTAQQPLDPDAQMTDIANASEIQALPSTLWGYHDRGAGSDPLVHPAQPAFDRMKPVSPDAPGFERRQTISPEDVGGLDAL